MLVRGCSMVRVPDDPLLRVGTFFRDLSIQEIQSKEVAFCSRRLRDCLSVIKEATVRESGRPCRMSTVAALKEKCTAIPFLGSEIFGLCFQSDSSIPAHLIAPHPPPHTHTRQHRTHICWCAFACALCDAWLKAWANDCSAPPPKKKGRRKKRCGNVAGSR